MAGPSHKCNKVIALVDMDCFYVQVEERDDPSIKGVPAAVVQYKVWKGGGIIAVNYEARARGVTRNMRGDDAKAVCPEIVLVRVPESNEKADLTKYRDAGKQVVDVLCEFSSNVERASIDEAYIDLTEAVNQFIATKGKGDPLACLNLIDKSYLENSFPFGFDDSDSWLESITSSEILQIDDVKLALGAEIVGRMRKAVYEKTGFRCSAGIAHNKVLAKLGAGLNKPNKQTVIPHESVTALYQQTKLKKVRSLGGQFGDILVEQLKCEKMSDLLKFSLKQLQLSLGDERGEWIYNLARGYDNEAVTPRQLPQSIGCSKNFMGREALNTKEKANFWINRLCIEVVERIQRDWEMNNRRAKLLTLHVRFQKQKAISRSCGKNNVPYDPDKMASCVITTMEKVYQQFGVLPINNLGLIASKLEEESSKNTKIDFFYRLKQPQVNGNSVSSSSSNSTVVKAVESIEEITGVEIETTSEVNDEDDCVILPPNDIINEEVEEEEGNKKEENEESPKIAQVEHLRAEALGMERIAENTPVKISSEPVENGTVSSEKRKPLFTCSFSPSKVKKFSLPQQTLFESSKSCTVNGKPINKLYIGATNAISSKLDNIPNNNNSISNSNKKHKVDDDDVEIELNADDNQVPCCSKSLGITNLVYDEESSSSRKDDIVQIERQEESCFTENHDYVAGNASNGKPLAKEYLQHCSRCDQEIPLWDYLSHTDFHVAMDLQDEFNKNNNNNNTNPSSVVNSIGNNNHTNSVNSNKNSVTESSENNTVNSGSKRPATSSGRGKGGAKRGRGANTSNMTNNSNNKQPQMKTLHSYFQPKN